MNALVQHEAHAISAPVHSFDDMDRMADVLAQSGLFGVKNKTQAMALMLVAQAEGEHPMSVATDYDIIQGKGTRKTHSVLARFQAMGGKIDWHELTDLRAEATFSHPKGGALRLEWTFDMAKKAGLTNKDNWKSYARAMLRARLIAEGVRAVYPAAIGGWQVPEEAMGPQLDAPPPATERHMGMADVVEPTSKPAAAPAPAAGPAPWPDDKLDARKAKAAEWAAAGKTADDVIAFLATKGSLSEAQEQRVRGWFAQPAKAQAEDVAPKVTYAQVYERMKTARTPDQLNDAAALIASIADETQRQELQTAYQGFVDSMNDNDRP